MSQQMFLTKTHACRSLCQSFALILLLLPVPAIAQNQNYWSNESQGNQFRDDDLWNSSGSGNIHNKDIIDKQNPAPEFRDVHFPNNTPRVVNQNVLIPMSTYQDLLNRFDSLESRVIADESRRMRQALEQGPRVRNEASQGRGGFYSRLEVVAAKPVFSSNTAFYISDIVVTAASADSTLQEFNWDLDDSYRLEFGYLNPSTNLGWRTRYWFFDTNAAEASPEDENIELGISDDPDIGIGIVSAGDDQILVAIASTNIDVLDIERFSKRSNYDASVIFSGGVRYAKIRHSYNGLVVDPVNVNGFIQQVQTDHVFEGVGPTISFTKRRPIFNSNFAIEVGGRGSIIFGSGDASWDFHQSNSTFSDAVVHPGSMRVVPVAELQIGLTYRRETRRLGLLELSTGLESQFWMNGGTPLDASQQSDSDSDRIASPWTEDLAFLGGYFRGSFNY